MIKNVLCIGKNEINYSINLQKYHFVLEYAYFKKEKNLYIIQLVIKI